VRARWIAEKLQPMLGQPIIVENRGGAGGSVATEAVAKSPPDGYTLALVHSGTLAVNPHLYARVGYDAIADFAHITMLTRNPLVLAVPSDSQARTVAELVALAKSKPGALFFGSPGNGTPPHMAAELFKRMSGIDVVHVPFKGGAQAQSELMAGRLAFTIEGPAIQLQQVKAGRLRALGVSSAQRIASMPDLPTIAEGVPGYEYSSWIGLSAPAGTPAAVVLKLQQEIAKALATPESKAFLDAQGAEGGGQSSAAFTAVVREDYAKWGKVVREAGLKAE
jgi:tripartite-type tricarboxylate transporter receptor subunit TctC